MLRSSTYTLTPPKRVIGEFGDDLGADRGRAMLSEYRQRFSEFHTELHREDYLFRSGRKQDRETAHIRAEYSDLFTGAVIADLRAKLEQTSELRETERK